MRIIPDSTITLYSNIPIDSDDEEQLLFKNKANQKSYFDNHIAIQRVNCQTVKKRGWLRINASGATVSQCNYMSFVNPSFDNKTVYCKIEDYNYVNNECVEIKYSIDAFQTWCFDANYSNMYIEREHLSEADYQKAENNPYDPSIFEFRTAEALPISQDTEKMMYDIKSRNNHNEENYDGMMCADMLARENNIGNDMGILIPFIDIDFAALDSASSPSTDPPSQKFITFLHDMMNTSPNYASFYRLTDNTYSYLNNIDNTISKTDKGSAWSDTSLGSLTPCSLSKLTPPINYIYICGGADNLYDDAQDLVTQFLSIMTNYSTRDSVLGLYAVPAALMMFSATAGVGVVYAGLETAKGQNVRNKKLDLYPFSYYRVISPNGDIKELRIEDFKEVQNGGNYGKISLGMDVTGNPTLIIAPFDYKMSKYGGALNAVDVNMKEALLFDQFPTLPYVINGYEAQLAATCNSIIGNNTMDYALDLMNSFNQLNAEQKKGIFTPDISQIFTLEKYHKAGIDTAKFDLEAQLSEEAYGGLSGEYGHHHGDAVTTISQAFQNTRPAYAQNEYHQSNGVGFVNYNDLSYIDVIFMRVSLNPQILAEYDKFFDLFGYSSGRCGTARAVNYMKGSTNAELTPHWVNDGNKQITYIKTSSLNVDGVMKPVSDAIASMFNAGVRFIKGD